MDVGVATPPSVLPDISPSRGEIRWSTHSAIPGVEYAARKAGLKQGGRLGRISPHEGEMSGRTEGGKFRNEWANGGESQVGRAP